MGRRVDGAGRAVYEDTSKDGTVRRVQSVAVFLVSRLRGGAIAPARSVLSFVSFAYVTTREKEMKPIFRFFAANPKSRQGGGEEITHCARLSVPQRGKNNQLVPKTASNPCGRYLVAVLM